MPAHFSPRPSTSSTQLEPLELPDLSWTTSEASETSEELSASSLNPTWSPASRPLGSPSLPTPPFACHEKAKASQQRPDIVSTASEQASYPRATTAGSARQAKPLLPARRSKLPQPADRRDRKTPTLSESLPSRAPKHELHQLHLALSVRPLAVRCSLCEMTYMRGSVDDESLHRSYCSKASRGIEWPLGINGRLTGAAGAAHGPHAGSRIVNEGLVLGSGSSALEGVILAVAVDGSSSAVRSKVSGLEIMGCVTGPKACSDDVGWWVALTSCAKSKAWSTVHYRLRTWKRTRSAGAHSGSPS